MNKQKLFSHLNSVISESADAIIHAHPDDREPDYYEGIIDLAEELIFLLGNRSKLEKDALNFWEL